jgi:natural product precursor
MKKINLRGLSEVLSEKELKNVLGGSNGGGGSTSGYCWMIECSDGWKKMCPDTFDTCISLFNYACPYGGFFYACGT